MYTSFLKAKSNCSLRTNPKLIWCITSGFLYNVSIFCAATNFNTCAVFEFAFKKSSVTNTWNPGYKSLVDVPLHVYASIIDWFTYSSLDFLSPFELTSPFMFPNLSIVPASSSSSLVCISLGLFVVTVFFGAEPISLKLALKVSLSFNMSKPFDVLSQFESCLFTL